MKRVYIAVGKGGDGTGLKSAKQVQGAAKERIGCDVSNFDRRMCQISGMNDLLKTASSYVSMTNLVSFFTTYSDIL